ncbi:MFS transporter [Acetobacter suratthaniensis]|uniref:MFS transporter n=1 Tax=Acetobacter suratthaniensis TaxID=1502841 RepID=A0ABS3LP43_9PROT|nr:MFS transporter [Acetobacter suratthaniensis]MBO1329136.1 MFS transporter [Acetobacter suratthaniensis]MCX2567166.1 MFS transporter [Acetobacter suratthaniensis]
MSTVSKPDEHEPDWQRNLIVCFFGSFTTLVAMTLMLPFLPLYVQQLGVEGQANIAQWSGIAYGATFLSAGLVAPLWGRMGDRYGRKLMLVRASLGMAVTMALMGCATTIWQLVGLRLIVGLAGGYSSGATIMVAAQAPRSRSAWALGLLASGVMAGNLVGPLIGGFLPPLIGIRMTFLGAGCLIFMAFLATLLLIRETPSRSGARGGGRSSWSVIPDKRLVFAMLGTGALLMIANMSIEPIITLYIRTLTDDPAHVTYIAGLVMSAAALGSILSASSLGRLADRVGHGVVIVGALAVAGLLLVPQAFVTAGWQLIGFRFLMGLSLGGLLPCISALIRHNVPDQSVGAVMGYAISAQYAGQVVGPLIGGFIGGRIGMCSVFVGTGLLLLFGALCNGWIMYRMKQKR